MGRTELPEGKGMLFLFEQPQRVGFWMRHTPLPLSIAYLDGEGSILELYDLEPFSEKVVMSRSSLCRQAIEVPRGWWQKVGAQPGDRVEGTAQLLQVEKR